MKTAHQLAAELLQSASIGDVLRAVTIATKDAAEAKNLGKATRIEVIDYQATATGLEVLHRALFPSELR